MKIELRGIPRFGFFALVLRLNGAHDLTIDADGAFIFASISAYRIDDFSGILAEVPGSPFAAGNNPDFIAIL